MYQLNQDEYIQIGIDGIGSLKIILQASIESAEGSKVGVVSVVFATMDKENARKRIQALIDSNPNNYYMVYSVPLDTDLSLLAHYPSIVVTKVDLQ